MIIRKNKLFILSILEIVLFLGLALNSYGADIEATSATLDSDVNLESYSIMSSEVTLSFNNFLANILEQDISIFNSKIGASLLASNSSYDLRDYYNIEVKDQGTTESCWAFSLLTSTELNLLMKSGISVDLSERHMNYATSTSFSDGTNPMAFNRTASEGASFIIGLAYLTNGQGAVLESQMKFSNDVSDISLSEIDIDPSYYVTGYEALPTIYKIKSDSGTLYTDGYGTYYSEEEVDSLRQIIKEHIVEYGAISSYTAGSALSYYNSDNVFDSTAYYCDDMSYSVDHAVTIIGWDDNYSKENFTGAAMPEKDGAYIVLNTFSDSSFDEGCIYISYEDVWIESMLYGVTSVSSIDYENLYQHDEFGANIPLTLTVSGGENVEEGYYASIYSRDTSISEELTEVAISTNQYAKFEIYVNPNGSSLASSDLQLVSSTDVLNPGYNTISFDGVVLTGSEFAVVVKQTAVDETYYFMIEAAVDGTMYSTATATAGDSQVSLDGINWYNLSDLGTIVYDGYLVDLSSADVCIKAFTKSYESSNESGVSSSVYDISSDNYITKIYDETTINEFLNNMSIINVDYALIDKNGVQVTDYTSYVTTNMILKTDDKSYILVVRGDLNCDGVISLIDISKQVLHYVSYEGFILSGAPAKAADMNLDGNFSLIDVSQLQKLYVDRT